MLCCQALFRSIGKHSDGWPHAGPVRTMPAASDREKAPGRFLWRGEASQVPAPYVQHRLEPRQSPATRGPDRVFFDRQSRTLALGLTNWFLVVMPV
jgi:hypothetical protein